jgi:hypothetical protein
MEIFPPKKLIKFILHQEKIKVINPKYLVILILYIVSIFEKFVGKYQKPETNTWIICGIMARKPEQ